MQASSKHIAKALMKSLETGSDPSKLSKSFEAYAKRNHMIGLLPNIISSLERELKEVMKKKSADIRVSHEMNSKVIGSIEKRVGVESGDVSVVSVDPELIGGFRAVYKGKVVDGSIRNYLKELRAQLVG